MEASSKHGGDESHARASLSAKQAQATPDGCLTHRAVHVFAALLILLLYPLLQEVDAQLEAEVLLLQVIQVLRQSTVTVRHDRQ